MLFTLNTLGYTFIKIEYFILRVIRNFLIGETLECSYNASWPGRHRLRVAEDWSVKSARWSATGTAPTIPTAKPTNPLTREQGITEFLDLRSRYGRTAFGSYPDGPRVFCNKDVITLTQVDKAFCH